MRTAPSRPPEASRVPSGLKAIVCTAVLCPRYVAKSVPDSACHIRTEPSVPPVPIFLLRGEKATDQSSLRPSQELSSLPPAVSQMRTVPSQPADASRSPLGSTARPKTGPACPYRGSRCFSESEFHRRTMLSLHAVDSVYPS